jgi:hypothetical protein
VCVGAIQGFLLRFLHNELPWQPDEDLREHYGAVGAAYSEGFAVGFFLCLFLTVAAVGVVAWLDRRREKEEVRIPVGPIGLVKNSK